MTQFDPNSLLKNCINILRYINIQSKRFIFKAIVPVLGLVALIWFLVRVIPKPSRAYYPCQRAAFPLATAFVIWIITFAASFLSFKKARKLYTESKYFAAVAFFGIALVTFIIMQVSGGYKIAFAQTQGNGFATIPVINDPDSDKAVVAPQGVVGIAQCSIPTEQLTPAQIDTMVRQAITLAGGFDSTLIKDGDTVVLKPNCVATTTPSQLNGQVTDWRVIQAVARLVRVLNPHGKIYIMEETAGYNSTTGKVVSSIHAMQQMLWTQIKYVDKCIGLEDSSGNWRDTLSSKLSISSLRNGKNLYPYARNKYYFNKIYYRANVIISIPIDKTHNYAAATGAVKCEAIGSMPWSIYGEYSDTSISLFSLRMPFLNHDSSDTYHDWLHDYYLARPVDYCVMDGLKALECGPEADPINNPQYLHENRVIIASKNAISMDAIQALSLGKDPFLIRYLLLLHNDSAGCAIPKYIRVNGVRVDQFKKILMSTAPYGNYANYTDITPPSASVNSFSINGQTMNLSLTTATKAEKVEISVAGVLTDSIYTKNFNNLTVYFGKTVTASDVQVLVYDHYLNCTVLDLSPTGVSEALSLGTALKAFPNPFTNEVTITANNIYGNANILVYNISGNLVASFASFSLSDLNNTINLGYLPKGVYFIKLSNGGGQLKVIKE
jgi:uncharacterized protein (DUF362 family)